VQAAASWLVIVAATSLSPVAAANQPGRGSTAAQQLVRAHPLGPQLLCCASDSVTHSTATSMPQADPPAQPASPTAEGVPAAGSPAGEHGGSAVVAILIGGAVAGGLVLSAAAGVSSRKRRQMARVAMEQAENAYRADERTAARRAFERGVRLHRQGDLLGAEAAYRRAESWGDADGAFNLGVLLYECGDLDGAEAVWRQCAERGHAPAAANLDFVRRERRSESGPPDAARAERRATAQPATKGPELPPNAVCDAFDLGVRLHERGDLLRAAAAYRRAESRGDVDAAFNLGVLLYEAGNLDDAAAVWRRCAAKGHARARANLDFLRRRRDSGQPESHDAPHRVGDAQTAPQAQEPEHQLWRAPIAPSRPRLQTPPTPRRAGNGLR